MDLRPSDEQVALVASFGALYDALSTPDKVLAAESNDPVGHSPELWSALRSTGVVEMAVPEASGGGGACLLDLTLVAERHGRAIGPAPVIETQIAARLLANVAGAESQLESALSGASLVTLALHPVANGALPLVPAGAVADVVIALREDALIAVPLRENRRALENQGSAPLADVTVTGESVIASGPEVVAAYAHALDEWRVLTAAALAGIAERSLEIGVDYVKERKAFGKPIGSFQAIAHDLADRKTEVDGSILIAREAAWAFEEDPSRASLLASMAFGFCAETARDTTHSVVQFHGGYGFMLEYAIQLYFRRARAWAAVLEGPRASYRRVGQIRLAAVNA